MRLLIVEDEKELCDTIAKSLYDVGYEVDTSYNGSEALEYVLTEEYDLIVLDLNLPGIDGMDILRELRRENEETKVLILSAAKPDSRIKWKGWMQEPMITWKNHFICRSLRRGSEA